MSAPDDKLMRRISKILALAERGEAGEKETAQAMLANILARHKLTLDDIAAKPARKWAEVTFSGKHEKLLMCQIIRKVTQQRDFYVKRPPKARGRFFVELSPAEQVEVEFMFEVMKRALLAEMDKVVEAFICANSLFGPRAEKNEDDEDDEPEITPERRAYLRQVAAMAMGMNRVDVRRAITQENT